MHYFILGNETSRHWKVKSVPPERKEEQPVQEDIQPETKEQQPIKEESST